MQRDKMGINQLYMDKLILDIYGYAEKIQKTLNQISNIVDKTKEYYICDEATYYRNRFELFKTNFSIINKNVISYANDLIKIKNRYQGINDEMSKMLKNGINKVDNSVNKKWEIPGEINTKW